MFLAEILAEEFSTTGASLWLVKIEGDLNYFPQNYLFDLYLIVLPAQQILEALPACFSCLRPGVPELKRSRTA